MSVSQHQFPSSIDLSGLPPRVGEAVVRMVAVCHRQFGPEHSPEAFEETERRVRESVNSLGCDILGACDMVPCGTLAEDDHDLARPGDLSASALP